MVSHWLDRLEFKYGTERRNESRKGNKMDLRKAYKKVGEVFVETNFWDLRQGDVAKLQESTGEWVSNGEAFLLTSDPYKNKEGVGTVVVDISDHPLGD
jgi:hypothetical protein